MRVILAALTLALASVSASASPPSPPPSSPDIVKSFDGSAGTSLFNHLVVDKNTGRIYVGAVNRLYQLSPDLDLAVNVTTGPKNDSSECSVLDCPQTAVLKPTDNVNKALVIDYTKSKLIACGSAFQGLCSVRNLHNVSDSEDVRESVVANNATASTVAFIAPGPPRPPETQVMYVGVTFTGNSPYRSEVPAISSRSLDGQRMFMIAQVAVTTGTRIFVNSLSRERYPITYVYGFSSGGFSYFLTTQPRAISGPHLYSKLVRVCHEDESYYSYTEIPIACTAEGRTYNLVRAAHMGKAGSILAGELGITAQDDVLFAVFAQSDPVHPNVPSGHSGLCVYSLKSIRRIFLTNIQSCFAGNGTRGLDFVSPSHACIPTKLQKLNEDFCGLDVNTPLGGEQPVIAVPVLTFSDTHLTAVTATSTGDYTVAFLGTSRGHLVKAVVESPKSGFQYGNITVDRGSPVNRDLHFDSQMMHLYVMTERRVSKVKVQECSVYTTCLTCLGVRDPHCGWCSLENKCSLRSNCQDAAKDPLYWISYGTGRCTTITQVNPHLLQRTTARTLELLIENLPSLQGPLLCAFTALDKTLVTTAFRKQYGVNCTTPRTDLLPAIPAGQHHITAKLSVRTTNGPDFVATNFTFFDCNTYGSCTQCVSSLFPCDWCVDGHRCTHDTAENCRNDILVTGVSRVGPSYRSGPGFCPTLNSTQLGSDEILVPSGLKKSIRVKVHIIGQFIVQTRFVCQFNIEGRVTSVNAQLLGDMIYCDPMEFTYTSRAPNITASFAVIWGGSKPLDNPENIHVLIYRCKDMADNCGLCLALAEKFGCGWCQNADRCEVKEQCGDRGTAVWLNRSHTCPNPEIHSFTPLLGPWEGGTNITIEGINLGRNFSDIYNGVTIAGISCQPVERLYVKTRQIVCTVDGPGTLEPREGPVVVRVEDYRGESKHHYAFVNPQIESMSPRYGPRSGGTQLRITGKYLNAGSDIQAFVDGKPCVILSTDSNEAVCRTSHSNDLNSGTLRMKFDKGDRAFSGEKFEYVQDPIIEYADSGFASQMKTPKGIPSGGIKIQVVGKYLASIQMPQMYVYHDNQIYIGHCDILSNTQMICDSPAIEIDGSELDAEKPLKLEYGFLMDDVLSVRNLSTKRNYSPFFLYPDPLYQKFDEDVKYHKSDYLTINGQNLDRACQEKDVEVMIGNSYCNVTSLSRHQLTCRPPSQDELGLDDDGVLPDVIVKVGHTLRYELGKLSFSPQSGVHGALSKPIVMGVGGAVILIICVFLIFLYMYRRKSTESIRVLRNMQEQMDILELRVAAECKEAFAELQTEMTDLTGDVTGGIPFLDYRTYAMKILFPNIEGHIVLQWDRPELLRKEKGLRMFGQLIMNKTFLLLFIRTLESNRYFSMRDRVNVASLIMVTLQSKMEYCTDVLKTLLAELIEKCMEGKSHPKLLLRRTESVAEKMLSAWFTFLLYKFLKECAGEPLYMLFRSMKGQVDKGPVDAITSEARYSLSEEKLIRQSIDFKSMSVYVTISQQTVFVSGLETNTENVQVKVLDCDTISQVKEKCLDTIYRATPHSQRPNKDDLDLEWRTGTCGRLILYDEDSTTKSEGEWKKLNTLHHYRVNDGSNLNLVSRQSSIYNLAMISDKNEKSHMYETLNRSKFSSASPPASPLKYDHNGTLKYWHLVKHHDNDTHKEGERGNKMVSEIYLTRLLATKGTLQKFVDDLFETIFSTAHRGSALPLAIKYMFDFLDDQALQHGISDPEVVHTWKSNSLPLRFWVNLIKNPNFVFDIHKSNTVDSCLSVIAQTFMDSCSTSEHVLGKDSPSSKLLYAKDIPIYKEWVDRYYSDIKKMAAISDQDMNAMLAEESRLHTKEFNTNCALHELYSYAIKYSEQLMVTLEEDEFSQKQRLAYKLEQVHNVMAHEYVM